MKLLQITPYLSQSHGGPFVSIRRLSQELYAQNVDIDVCGVNYGSSESNSADWLPLKITSTPGSFPRTFCYGADLTSKIAAIRPNIIHTHGLWLFPHLASYRYCALHNIPLVVSPRGMLESWAFRHKAWKKLPLWWAYEKRALQSAFLLHATAEHEAVSLRGIGFTNPIAIIPNGVDLPETYSPLPTLDGAKTALFLSRIHPIKGLMNLIDAWSKVRPSGWRMIIAGPQEMGHETELREAVKKAGLDNIFEFVGPIFDERKSTLMRQANLFILPSFTENFGIAIAEALSYGIPVITTKGTPWKELEDTNSGWWVDIGVDPLSEALYKATRLSVDEIRDMGLRGRQLVEERYAWKNVAKKMKSVYQWILDGGQPPSCII